jgi:hypothetical protein
MKRDISKKVEKKVKDYFIKKKNDIKSNSSGASRNSK